jgi:DNA polymerase family B
VKIFEDEGRQFNVDDATHARLVEMQIEREYLDKRQYNLKIKMNSLYGALSNEHFRYFDPRLGNSTTGTGRMVLDHITKMVGLHYDGEYAYPSPSAIYGDTDSSYFATNATTLEEAIKSADTFSKVVSASMVDFMHKQFLCQGDAAKGIKVARECVADKALFVKKKMYMMHVVDKKGKTVDDPKIMGLMLKKTQIPKVLSKKLSAMFMGLLAHQDWSKFNMDLLSLRDEIKVSDDVKLLGLPKSAKEMDGSESACRNPRKGDKVSGHIRAAWYYNLMLEAFNDKEHEPITSGSKIKLYYLKSPQGPNKAIAIPTDVNPIPQWFLEHFWPLVDIEAQLQRLIDSPASQILQALGKRVPTHNDLIASECLEFD